MGISDEFVSIGGSRNPITWENEILIKGISYKGQLLLISNMYYPYKSIAPWIHLLIKGEKLWILINTNYSLPDYRPFDVKMMHIVYSRFNKIHFQRQGQFLVIYLIKYVVSKQN